MSSLRVVVTSLLFAVCCGHAPGQGTPLRHPDGTTHWYEAVAVTGGLDWASAHAAAATKGGYLATITSAAEGATIGALIQTAGFWTQRGTSNDYDGPWLGGVQASGAQEPDKGWGWIEVEAFGYTNWRAQEPDNQGGADRIHFFADSTMAPTWGDAPAASKMPGYVVEYSGPLVPQTVGLLRDDKGSHRGYTLIDAAAEKNVYLVDARGRIAHRWATNHPPAVAAYLMPNGDLVRTGNVGNATFTVPGGGGAIERYDWDGNLLWSFEYSTGSHCLHHDIEVLPNGNILAIVWDRKTATECAAAGRDPLLLTDGELWPLRIVEFKPRGTNDADIVWEWKTWDHLVQDHDNTKANYGDVKANPQLIDVNYAIDGTKDWLHTNAIDYNATLDQVMVSARHFDEMWIIDHSTTTAQAAGHTGGTSGKGGDLLYRWGNPITYRRGTATDRQLFRQHDTHWIPDGLPGAGNVLLFNNGVGRTPPHSTVDELVLPVPDTKGNYAMTSGVWGPAAPKWTYKAANPADFNSGFVSGAQRLPNGNTLICAGATGHAFEVTSTKRVLWEYESPVDPTGPVYQGTMIGGNITFRAPWYPPDFAPFQTHALLVGDPIERYGTALLVDGARIPVHAKLEQMLTFSLRSPAHPGHKYRLATCMRTPTLLPIDHRFIRIGIDPVLTESLTGGFPTVFHNYKGYLDRYGRATAHIVLPNIAAMVGNGVYTAFVIGDVTAPSGVAAISNTVTIEVE